MNISIGERSRTEWVDIAKGIGIVCVCLGHLGIESIDRVVFTFHMPLFFILSGMFLNGDVPFNEFIKKKSKRLLVPYYVTGDNLFPRILGRCFQKNVGKNFT